MTSLSPRPPWTVEWYQDGAELIGRQIWEVAQGGRVLMALVLRSWQWRLSHELNILEVTRTSLLTLRRKGAHRGRKLSFLEVSDHGFRAPPEMAAVKFQDQGLCPYHWESPRPASSTPAPGNSWLSPQPVLPDPHDGAIPSRWGPQPVLPDPHDGAHSWSSWFPGMAGALQWIHLPFWCHRPETQTWVLTCRRSFPSSPLHMTKATLTVAGGSIPVSAQGPSVSRHSLPWGRG